MRSLLVLSVFVWVAWFSGVTFGQFQLDIEQLAEVSYVTEEPVPNQKQPQQGNRFAVQQNIDAWIFNRHKNAKGAKRHLENQLQATVETLGTLFNLSDDQKVKLRLAGTGDMSAFFSEVDVIRKEFDNQIDQNQIGQIWQRVQPLQQRMQKGLFSRDSLLAKVSKRTLSAEQLKVYERRESERIQFGYRAAIKQTIAGLGKSTPFLAEQRDRIVELLEDSATPKMLGQHINYYVLFRLSEIENQLKTILKPSQLKAMQQSLNQGRAMQQFLKQNGFID